MYAFCDSEQFESDMRVHGKDINVFADVSRHCSTPSGCNSTVSNVIDIGDVTL